MTPELRAALLAVAEARAALNAADEPTDELRAALTTADNALAELLRADPPNDPDPIPVNGNGDGPEDPEARERRELRSRASVGRILALRAGQSIIDGAEAEVAAAHGCAPGRIPVEMILGDLTEERAASGANQVQSTNTAPIAPNVFKTALARELGISQPTVPAGIAAYPYISGDGAAGPALPGEADANNAKAATVSVASIWPARVTGTIEWQVEDAAVLGDLETALRANIRSVMEDAMDTQLLSGTGNQSVGRKATPDAAGLKGLLTQYPAVQPADKPVSTVAQIVAAATGMLDGTYAERFGDIRLFTSVGAARFLKGILRVEEDAEDMVQYLERSFASLRYSARIADNAAATGKAGYAALLGHRTSRGLGGIAPVWQGIETIVDQITQAAKGVVSVTLRMQMGGVLVLRSSAYTVATLKTVVGT